MTILTQLHVIRLLVLGVLLILPATSGAQQRPPILEKLTKDLWSRIVWADRSDPLHLQRSGPGTQCLQIMDLGTQNRPGHL